MSTKIKPQSRQAERPRQAATDASASNDPEDSIRYIVNAAGERVAVVMSVASYEQMRESLEDMNDALLYDEGKCEGGDPIPLAILQKHREV